MNTIRKGDEIPELFGAGAAEQAGLMQLELAELLVTVHLDNHWVKCVRWIESEMELWYEIKNPSAKRIRSGWDSIRVLVREMEDTILFYERWRKRRVWPNDKNERHCIFGVKFELFHLLRACSHSWWNNMKFWQKHFRNISTFKKIVLIKQTEIFRINVY